jgi:hypothetical protein
MDYSVTFNSDGSESSKSLGAAMAETTDNDGAGAPVVKMGNERFRAQVTAEGGVEVSRSVAGSAKVNTSPAGPYMLDAYGNPQDIADARPDSEVFLPGKGSSSAAAWVAAGFMRKTATGYVVVGQDAPPANPNTPATDKPSVQPEKVEAAVDPALLHDVKPTTQEADDALATVTKASPIAVEAMIEAAARGVEVDYEGAGQYLGDGGAARLGAAVAEHREAGSTVLRNLGVDPVKFESYLLEADPDAASTIARDVLVRKDMGSLIRAAKSYQAWRSNQIVSQAEASNVPARIAADGTVYFNRAALGLPAWSGRGDFRSSEISLKDAQAQGLIELSE